MFSAEAYFRHGHGPSPVVVHTAGDIDTLIDELLAEPRSNSLADLYIRERPLNSAGFPDHELGVGVDAARGVGGLSHLGPDGTWYTLGARSDLGEVSYSYMGNDTPFPIDSEIPLDLVRRAAKEFLTSGGRRPTCVRWQPYTPPTSTPPESYPPM